MYDRHPQLAALIPFTGLQQMHIDHPDAVVEQQLGGRQDHRTTVLGADDSTLNDFHRKHISFSCPASCRGPFAGPQPQVPVVAVNRET